MQKEKGLIRGPKRRYISDSNIISATILKEEFNEDDEEINKPFELTEKKRIADITTELPNVIHRPYGYYEYSEMDDSNARFMKKQENTNTFRDDIFTQVNTEENNKKTKKGDDMKDLFESTEE